MATGSRGERSKLRPDFEVGNCRMYLGLRPLVILDIGNTDGPALTELLARFDEYVLARKERFVTVTDCRRMTAVPSADVRRAIAEWMKKNEKDTTGIGAVTILDSAIVRGALTAVYWLVQPVIPQGTASTWEEAHRWAMATIDAANVPVPPSVREARDTPY